MLLESVEETNESPQVIFFMALGSLLQSQMLIQ